jgi:hypothetical protein
MSNTIVTSLLRGGKRISEKSEEFRSFSGIPANITGIVQILHGGRVSPS